MLCRKNVLARMSLTNQATEGTQMNKYDLASKAIRMYNSCTTFKHMQHTDKWVEMAKQDWDIDMSLEVNRARYAKIYELKRTRPEQESRWWNRLEHLKFRAEMFS